MAQTFADLWNELKAEAKSAVAAAKAELKSIETTIVPMVEADIASVLSQYKGLATSLIINFAGEAFKAVSGQEKMGQVVTAVYQSAIGSGKRIAIQDAQMFAQQAFQAVATQLSPPQ